MAAWRGSSAPPGAGVSFHGMSGVGLGAPLWRLEAGGASVHIMGSAPPGPEPWRSAVIEALVAEAEVFWSETPAAGPETVPLAIQYGVVTGRPLASWIDEKTLSRVEQLAQELDVAASMLSAVRPWLAWQLLQNAQRERAGIPFSNGCEPVLNGVAEERGVRICHEFPTIESVMQSFVQLSAEAEAGYLSYNLDELEAEPEVAATRRQRWELGDLEGEDALSERVAVLYPAFYDELVVARNRAWIGRVEEAVSEGRAFLLIGTGHLVGPGNVVALLAERGLRFARL